MLKKVQDEVGLQKIEEREKHFFIEKINIKHWKKKKSIRDRGQTKA